VFDGQPDLKGSAALRVVPGLDASMMFYHNIA
jgi:hypothetical protein